MTDIWRSFVAQRIAWEYGWGILFHESTVKQERNEHNLMEDFRDEVVGYSNNNEIMKEFAEIQLKPERKEVGSNMIKLYETLIEMKLVAKEELILLKSWLNDI
jgi:hypothetical protein